LRSHPARVCKDDRCLDLTRRDRPVLAQQRVPVRLRNDAEAVAEVERRGKDWSGDKVKQYSAVMRADFGAFVARKRYRLI
jgi:hypothetical protein